VVGRPVPRPEYRFGERCGKPIFWTERSVSGTVEKRLRWLEDSLQLVYRLRSEGLPLVCYTWWPLFSLLDWVYREGEKPPEDYLWHMGMYDLEPDGTGVSPGWRRPW
jgi:beta-glucosidase